MPAANSHTLAGMARPSLLTVLALLALSAPATAADGPRVTTFVSGGKTVTMEQFLPARPGKHPALLLLHGSDGLADRRGEGYRAAAHAITARGYAVLLVHYFDRTGTTYADRDTINKHFLPGSGRFMTPWRSRPGCRMSIRRGWGWWATRWAATCRCRPPPWR